jgi:hypothetical protein
MGANALIKASDRCKIPIILCTWTYGLYWAMYGIHSGWSSTPELILDGIGSGAREWSLSLDVSAWGFSKLYSTHCLLATKDNTLSHSANITWVLSTVQFQRQWSFNTPFYVTQGGEYLWCSFKIEITKRAMYVRSLLCQLYIPKPRPLEYGCDCLYISFSERFSAISDDYGFSTISIPVEFLRDLFGLKRFFQNVADKSSKTPKFWAFVFLSCQQLRLFSQTDCFSNSGFKRFSNLHLLFWDFLTVYVGS